MLSAELGPPDRLHPSVTLDYRRELLLQGYPVDYVAVQLVINVVAWFGLAARVTDTLERLPARSATPLAT